MEMVVDGFESWPNPTFSKQEDWEAYEAMSGCQQAAHKARLCYAAMLAAAPAADSAMAKHAERYRWLRDIKNTDAQVFVEMHSGEKLDAVIDAAIAASAKKGDE
ncbi:hypothetical protein BN2476_340001 [Paraburkholderia piptadeniae]|uniref:Uncharacterized protein n=1 Tax=Paraburkholderia piptadeniae TaxID=1701573 RepID=A0A1N7S6L2_9BURK|nr:hypothetical protein [Paraburkholderia piptadeniae]SIT42969.1 hypothetical protein BN2476_340001 [Paraburkholderia piptadeniae]